MGTGHRLAAWVAGLWAGMLLGIGAVAAPSLFAVLDRGLAGQVAARMFMIEAYASLGLAVALILWERRRASAAAGAAAGLWLMLGVLFCTVLGYFGLQPTMEAARRGQALWLSFGAAHGVSSALFVLKGVLIAVYAWVSLRPPARAAGPDPSSASA